MMTETNPPTATARPRIRWLALSAAVVGIVVVVWFAIRPSPAAQFQAGLDAISNSDLSRAADVARRLSNQPGFEPHSHLLQGAILLKRGKQRESLDELRQALDHQDTKTRAMVFAGEALAKLHQSLQAAELLRQALAIEPDNVDAHRWAGIAYYDLGAMEPAVHHLEQLTTLDLTDPRPHRLMGLIYKDLENDQQAVKSYQESLRRSTRQPDVEAIRTELAEVQLRLNRHDDARQTLSECTPSARVSVLMAECEYALGNRGDAKDLLASGLQQDPRDAKGLLLQGTIALDEGRPQEAVESFQQVVKLDPTDFSARFKLSQAFAQDGDDAKANAQLAIMNDIKAVRKEANEVYQHALRQPRDAEARFRLGILSEKLRRPDLARMWYQAALAIEPTHGPALGAIRALGPDRESATR